MTGSKTQIKEYASGQLPKTCALKALVKSDPDGKLPDHTLTWLNSQNITERQACGSPHPTVKIVGRLLFGTSLLDEMNLLTEFLELKDLSVKVCNSVSTHGGMSILLEEPGCAEARMGKSQPPRR